MSVNFSRIEVLARRLGVGFREAARLVGRKGARIRRERRAAAIAAQARPVRQWWQEGQYQ